MIVYTYVFDSFPTYSRQSKPVLVELWLCLTGFSCFSVLCTTWYVVRKSHSQRFGRAEEESNSTLLVLVSVGHLGGGLVQVISLTKVSFVWVCGSLKRAR